MVVWPTTYIKILTTSALSPLMTILPVKRRLYVIEHQHWMVYLSCYWKSEKEGKKCNSALVCQSTVLFCSYDRLLNSSGKLLTRTNDLHHPAKHCPSVPVFCWDNTAPLYISCAFPHPHISHLLPPQTANAACRGATMPVRRIKPEVRGV